MTRRTTKTNPATARPDPKAPIQFIRSISEDEAIAIWAAAYLEGKHKGYGTDVVGLAENHRGKSPVWVEVAIPHNLYDADWNNEDTQLSDDQEARARRYAASVGRFPPGMASFRKSSKSGKAYISDGNHRAYASFLRGEPTARFLMPLPDYERYVAYLTTPKTNPSTAKQTLRPNTTANLRALDVRRMRAEIERGNAKRLGSGNFGQTYRVVVGRNPYVVKVPVEKNIHGRTWKPHELREAFQAEANAATKLRKLGHTIAPSTLYTEVDGVPVIVREYGEPTILTQEEYDDLSLRLRAVVDAGWAIEDELLVMRRPNRSLFVADVGLWHPYTAKSPRERQDAQWHAEVLVKTLGRQQPWSNKVGVPPKSALKSIESTYKEAREGLDDPEFYAILVGEEAEDRQKAVQIREQAGFTRHNPATAKRTHPALWERVKAEITASSKGGRPGQWSARKAQFAVAEYKARGGGYIGPKTPDNALTKWTEERWRTRSGLPSLETGERYLPTRAITALTASEYAATSKRKRAGMRHGQQFVSQPESVAVKTAKYRRNPPNPRTVTQVTKAAREALGDPNLEFVRGDGYFYVLYGETGMTDGFAYGGRVSAQSLDRWVREIREAIAKAER